MGLETGTYINDLVVTNPTATDPKSAGDDHFRLVKSVLKNSLPGFTGIILGAGTEAQGATVNDFTVTLSPAPAAYTANTIVAFKATHANTGAATLQIGALGTKTFLSVDGSALSNGDITSGEFVVAIYDGTQFYLLSGNDRASRDGDTYAGTHNFTGANLTVKDQTANNNSSAAANTKYVDASTAAEAGIRAAADALLAPISSPTFTGTPQAPTRPLGTGGNAIATMGALAAASLAPAASIPPDPFFKFGII
jgi:hypothetical protein